jgi:hypothetical protein
MALRKLYKDPDSGNGGCPTVYVTDQGRFVVQSDQVDGATHGELENVLSGETAVEIDAEIVIKAVEIYLAQRAGSE